MNLLKNIATIGSGQNAPQEESEYSVLGKTFIKVSNLDDIIQDQNESRACKITADAINKNKLKLYPKNTIIFAKSGLSCVKNRVYLTKDDSYIVNHLCTISNIKNDYYPKWLLYFIKNYDVTKLIHDESYPSISLKDIGKIEIPEVGLNIQILISNQLDFIIETINKKLVQLNQLNELVKSRFIEMFGDPIQNEKAWNSSILNEVTDVRDGTHDSPKYHDRGYPFVTSKNLIDGKIDFSTCQLISEEDYLHFNDRSRVDDGDILMPMIGTIGGAIIVKKDREFSIKNVALIKFTKDNTKINRTFILYILNSDSMNNYFELTKKGGTQKFIALGVIRNIPIIVPPIELQNEFDKFIVQKEIKDLQELLDKKMDEYFGQ